MVGRLSVNDVDALAQTLVKLSGLHLHLYHQILEPLLLGLHGIILGPGWRLHRHSHAGFVWCLKIRRALIVLWLPLIINEHLGHRPRATEAISERRKQRYLLISDWMHC